LSAQQYIEATQKLKPDLVIGLADVVTGKPPGIKRKAKMVDRTHAYTRDALERLYGDAVAANDKCQAAYFAPILPLDNAQQSLYLDDLADEFRDRLSGLALYESACLTFIPESLGNLPRLLISDPRGPHAILREVLFGADLLTIPFVADSSDAGIALDFTFPAPPKGASEREPLALGIDMWSSEYAKDTSSLREGCQCYACRRHHRAYFNHLLAAKEMAAWALLQMHNLHTMDLFFQGVRESIQRGSFEQDVEAFNRTYASTLPESTGQGPRYVGTCTDWNFNRKCHFLYANEYLDFAPTSTPPGPTNPAARPEYMVVLTMHSRSSKILSLLLLLLTLMQRVSRNMASPERLRLTVCVIPIGSINQRVPSRSILASFWFY
jgi:queuine tRNA-ribosyltransferase